MDSTPALSWKQKTIQYWALPWSDKITLEELLHHGRHLRAGLPPLLQSSSARSFLKKYIKIYLYKSIYLRSSCTMAFSYALLKGLGCVFPAAVAGLQLSSWTGSGCTKPTWASPTWSLCLCVWHSVGSWNNSSGLVQGWTTGLKFGLEVWMPLLWASLLFCEYIFFAEGLNKVFFWGFWNQPNSCLVFTLFYGDGNLWLLGNQQSFVSIFISVVYSLFSVTATQIYSG